MGVSVSGPGTRVTLESGQWIVPRLTAAATALSELLAGVA
jgi:DNA-binding IclR family transcriptional regulator